MMRCIMSMLLACATFSSQASAQAVPEDFSFGVISLAPNSGSGERILKDAIAASDRDNLAFVLATGIKTDAEPCSDDLYTERKEHLDSAKNGVVLSLSGSDWVGCRQVSGKSATIERLSRLREQFFVDAFSFGKTRIPLIRQSLAPKFRNYGENARWIVGDVLFATLNLPAPNNHYLPAAGRNNEFEDRLIANRDWLRKLFILAARRNVKGIVLFSDANPLDRPSPQALATMTGRRDGFRETRHVITSLARRFPGKVLIVHRTTSGPRPASNQIVWHGNLGHLKADHGNSKVTFNAAHSSLFSKAQDEPEKHAARR